MRIGVEIEEPRSPEAIAREILRHAEDRVRRRPGGHHQTITPNALLRELIDVPGDRRFAQDDTEER